MAGQRVRLARDPGKPIPRLASALRISSTKMPSPLTCSAVPSGHSGRPPRSGSELVTVTPIDGLPSTPTSTTSSPLVTRTLIAAATASASRSQWRR